MAPLAQTLALLAMTTATVAIDVVYLDMAPKSFDDQYQGCQDKMTAALPELKSSDFKNNSLFAQAWEDATAEWQKRGSRVYPLSSSDQAIAVMAYTMRSVYKKFNKAVREVGLPPGKYQSEFRFKALHFLLTTLKDNQCHNVYRGVSGVRFEAKQGQTVRFGQFTSTSLNKMVSEGFGTDTFFQVTTCYGVDIQQVSFNPREQEVLIPPFETFTVTQVTQDGDKTRIWLRSNGAESNYNCEWLRDGSSPRDTPMLGQLLLATATLAVATEVI